MACFRASIRSFTMEMDTLVNVVIPYDYFDAQGNPGKYNKVLYLLHGLKQNADAWQRMSSAERYADYYGYAIVMPEVQRSFYTDMAHGPAYFTYLTEELPRTMHAIFKLPTDPARTFVGGLSMGGYGALKCALNYPDRYAGAMCFSSGFDLVTDPDQLMSAYHGRAELEGLTGADLRAKPEDDLYAVIRDFPAGQKKPHLYIACGTEDYLHQKNTEMRDHLIAGGFDPCYEEWPGSHNWIFWDAALQKGMVYMAEKCGE